MCFAFPLHCLFILLDLSYIYSFIHLFMARSSQLGIRAYFSINESERWVTINEIANLLYKSPNNLSANNNQAT